MAVLEIGRSRIAIGGPSTWRSHVLPEVVRLAELWSETTYVEEVAAGKILTQDFSIASNDDIFRCRDPPLGRCRAATLTFPNKILQMKPQSGWTCDGDA